MEKLPPSPEMIKQTLEELDGHIGKLEHELKESRNLRQTWAAILQSLLFLREQNATDAQEFVATGGSEIAVGESSQSDSSENIILPEYGVYTKNLRGYIVDHQDMGCSRSDIVAYARTLQTSTNFPYHFVKRMIENGELLEQKTGRYQATALMVEKVRGYEPRMDEKG